MRNKVLFVVLIASLVLNTVFAVGFVVSRFTGNDRMDGIPQDSKPGIITPVMRCRIKNSVKKYITYSFRVDGLKYISKDLYIEKAYMSPFNEKSCVEAAGRIIRREEQIKSDENQVLNLRIILESQPGNQSAREQIAICESRINDNREAIAANERIILNRDSGNDGKFMGYFVRHRFRVEDDEDNWSDFYVRFMVNSNGRLVLFEQDLIKGNAYNYDMTSDVIREVLSRK